MATCAECIHDEVCDKLAHISCFLEKGEVACDKFKSRTQFVELPFPISEGTKLYYIFEDIDNEIKVGKNQEPVTRVCKDGFYVSGDLRSDGTYSDDNYFYPWNAIGTEYFFTREAAEQALKECENDGK